MTELTGLAEQVGEALLKRGRVLATAESCTGGWVAKLVTDVVGSSEWFDRGFVTYSNASKQDMLGVPAETLESDGAVSENTVTAMVSGALHHSCADVALAISGIAGPGGGRPGKPVGTVCFAWQQRGRAARVETQHFSGDRNNVRQQAVFHALRFLLNELERG